MAARPQFDFSSVEPYQRVIPASRHSRRAPRQFQLTVGQMLIAWSVCGGLMVATFFFGLFTGKERGMQLALEEQARLALRVPLPDRSAAELSPLGQALSEKAANLQESLPLEAPVPAAQETSTASAPQLSEKLPAVEKTSPLPAVSAGETIADRVAAQPGPEAKPQPQTPTASESQRAPDKKPHSAVEPVEIARRSQSESVSAPTPTAAPAPGYYVQISAKRELAAASELAGKLSAAKYAVEIEEAQVGGKQFFRVLVGPHNSSKLAKAQQKKLHASGLAQKSAFVKQVK